MTDRQTDTFTGHGLDLDNDRHIHRSRPWPGQWQTHSRSRPWPGQWQTHSLVTALTDVLTLVYALKGEQPARYVSHFHFRWLLRLQKLTKNRKRWTSGAYRSLVLESGITRSPPPPSPNKKQPVLRAHQWGITWWSRTHLETAELNTISGPIEIMVGTWNFRTTNKADRNDIEMTILQPGTTGRQYSQRQDSKQ